MVAVNTVAKTTQPTRGRPAWADARSTRFAWSTNATLVATNPAAATVLAMRFCRLKNNRLQPPIVKTFHPQRKRALERVALGEERSNR